MTGVVDISILTPEEKYVTDFVSYRTPGLTKTAKTFVIVIHLTLM